ncbi:MAG TPA: GNAT family N-acetyltransferase [Candidatus Ornithomonoglobus merdipullorum]|uniref:GNAT family N-acetyltransferase n=1 Tax=Candidatus Ornithomonoglobus merdipullorum TaxID=2840895 RepID=A0A9D1MCQ9_9FIRM|nr:GNAT family N-acetyltransferase [Candidatus Ornithomonoglobus merdipullorum]
MIKYRTLQEQELSRSLFSDFIRHQDVDLCLRRENGEWVTRSDPFIDDWSEADYQVLIDCLRNTLRTDGLVYGAFINDALKGFVSVESRIFGEKYKYMDLSSLHVSEDARRNGIGRSLFIAAANWAMKRGAEKLYISAHSAVETQAFYISMGCSDAAEYNQEHVSAEPYDRQMEYTL